MNVYNWNSNVLELKSKRGVHYRLELKGEKTVVKGESATGKTYLCSLLEMAKSAGKDVYNVDNIVLINRYNKGELKKLSDTLIVIDKADLILDEKDVKVINQDRNNRYLIFARIPIGIEISPNYKADMITEDGITKLKYRFNVKGWN